MKNLLRAITIALAFGAAIQAVTKLAMREEKSGSAAVANESKNQGQSDKLELDGSTIIYVAGESPGI